MNVSLSAVFRRSILVLLIAAAFHLVGKRPGLATVYPVNPNTMMGNPSQAKPDPREKDNYLMEKPHFSLSYNDSKGTPNWASWRLTADTIGKAKRFPFYPDQTLPRGFGRIVPKDYTNDGFDRGHMCPHEDRSADEEMSRATFVMSNIIPQAKNVNEQAWKNLEDFCRDLVMKGKTLYIVAGPAGKKGQCADGGWHETIGTTRKVTVPSACWKVIMVLDSGPGYDPAKVNANTRLIAVIMPNDLSVGSAWKGYRRSVKDVETLTGYHFFENAPHPLIDRLKEKTDDGPTTAR